MGCVSRFRVLCARFGRARLIGGGAVGVGIVAAGSQGQWVRLNIYLESSWKLEAGSWKHEARSSHLANSNSPVYQVPNRFSAPLIHHLVIWIIETKQKKASRKPQEKENRGAGCLWVLLFAVLQGA